MMKAGHAPELSAASTSEPSDLSCDVCHKRYIRQCDLNKHYKTHSRPFKCPILGCKFQERGWPTEKELIRHQNDKHSASPQVFRCTFQPCDYTSKRESNCKQHMEKNHGWQYVRSRPPRQSLSSGANTSGCLEPQEQGDRSPHGHAGEDGETQQSDPPVFPWAYQPHPPPLDPELLDPGLAANNQETSHDLPLDAPSDAREPQYDLETFDYTDKESNIFLPWDSPPTKLKKMETVLAQLPPSLFTATTAAWPAPLDNASGDAEILLSPAIKVAHSPIPDFMPLPPLDAPCPDIQGQRDYSDDRRAALGQTSAENKAKPEHGHRHKRSVDYMSTVAGRATGSHDGAYGNDDADGDLDSNQDDDAEGDDDEDGDDEPPPRKKPRASLEDGFDDAAMESTRRHFKRAAHRLTVEDLYISSFDVTYEAGIRHPAAGLCRKCWRAYTDRAAFNRHINEPGCPRVSRREDAQASSHQPRLGEPVAWPAEGAPGPKRQDSGMSDKESLVGGMTSQSTDVDRDGLIPEVNRTLSTASSDTDRSAIRHVPHAESQDLHAVKPQASRSVNEPPGIAHSRSITDSGFVSDGHGGDVSGVASVPLGAGGHVDASSSARMGDEAAASSSSQLDGHRSQSQLSFGQARESIPSEFFVDAISAYEEGYEESRGQWP
ncbi:hypothetical protein GGTG_08170 [Gaeumannomyces tritici R3-111a-1]|uniref:C2H2-type domain-containing protein n=1 Tax=Gaeumannomyces tritici (strain R3-111a-1) TaxID=644352 RepID=J3P3T5_GAET3|nr:hypothetical protein GGTG_08170 [Gaeumannomyces tritici R3-111a-1]EJT74329.1 hypothetical protein GGTG_08170 [Gaeumannomyces tritici R3-111a-1]